MDWYFFFFLKKTFSTSGRRAELVYSNKEQGKLYHNVNFIEETNCIALSKKRYTKIKQEIGSFNMSSLVDI